MRKAITRGQTSILFRKPEWVPVLWDRDDTTRKLEAIGLVVNGEEYPCDHFYLNGGCDSYTSPQCFSGSLRTCGIRVSLPKEADTEADRNDLHRRLNLALSTSHTKGYHQSMAENGLRIIQAHTQIMSDPDVAWVWAPRPRLNWHVEDSWESGSIIVHVKNLPILN